MGGGEEIEKVTEGGEGWAEYREVKTVGGEEREGGGEGM